MWGKEITKRIQTRISIKTKEKDRFETQYYAACLCEYIPILSMTDKKYQQLLNHKSELHQTW